MKLSSLSEQTNQKGQVTSGFIINVNYDEVKKTWDSIISVEAYDYKTGTKTDLTHIFNDQFPNPLFEMVEQVDWSEIYLAQIEEVEPEKEDSFFSNLNDFKRSTLLIIIKSTQK
jgi:hypothetical protein